MRRHPHTFHMLRQLHPATATAAAEELLLLLLMRGEGVPPLCPWLERVAGAEQHSSVGACHGRAIALQYCTPLEASEGDGQMMARCRGGHLSYDYLAQPSA